MDIILNMNNGNFGKIASQLRRNAENEDIRVTAHAHQEMVEDNFRLQDVIEALQDAVLLENYSQHKRGPCCLICGKTSDNRYIHIVCTTSKELTVIITVYEPQLPKWKTPFRRTNTDEM